MTEIMNKPAVSVVIPCFNAARFLQRSIESVVGQTHRDLELIVVDDGSTDDSVAVAREMASTDARVRVHVLSERRGVAAARNAGLEVARGKYVAFLDADDWWMPAKLEKQLAAAAARAAGLVYSAVEVRDEGGKVLGHRRVSQFVTAEGLLRHNEIATSSVLIDLRVTGPIRMPLLERRQDLATWYALLERGVRAYGLDEPLIAYTKRRGSLSSNKLRAALSNWKLYRQHLGLNLGTALRLFASYVVAAVRRV